jgi:CheY-like chemotaxis protein
MFGLNFKKQPEKISLNVTSSPVRNGKRIVLVDDDQVILKAFSSRLERDGFTVFLAESCSDALAVIRQENPDVVLFDMNFPPEIGAAAWDGLALMKWMRYSASLQIPVIIITASKDESIKKRALEAGAAGFFDKSKKYSELQGLIHRALNSALLKT